MTLPKGYLALHYMPNTEGETRRGRPLRRKYMHRIAYTGTMRGVNDDIPTLLFLGAPFELLRDVCRNIFKMMAGNVRDITINQEHSCRVKNGKQYWRMAVGVVGLNEQLISLPEFFTLIVSCIRRTANCAVRYYKTETFLNL